MKFKNLLLIAFALIINFGLIAQCYDDECDDDNDIPIPGCCTATTAGMTWSGYGDVGCVNMGSGIPDVWVSFTAPTTGYIEVTIDNLTQDGPTQFVVFDHMNSEVCASLNSFGILAGYGCSDIPGDGAGGTTFTQTVQYAVEAGERYWVLVSADVTAGATAGTFEICIDVVSIPPPPPPLPGQDCTNAAILCSGDDFSQGSFTGIGIAENTDLNGCINANEQQSKWYTFTVSQSGTFEMIVDPNTNTNDYDYAVYNTTSSCYTSGVILPAPIACNWSGCPGNTGFTSQALCPGIMQYDCVGNPGDCSSSQLTNTVPTLTAGQTYTILIDNFSAANSGFTALFGGTAIMAPQQANADFTSTLISAGCEAQLDLSAAAIPNYTYFWDFGDGTTYTGSTPPDHYYSTPGTYIVSLTVTDALGCMVDNSLIIDVADCTVTLPVGLITFEAKLNEEKDKVDLNWATNSEQDNDYFTVEKSVNGYNWERLGEVKGAGNSMSILYYDMVDNSPYFPTTYYRLKQTDFNGAYSYSDIVSTTNETKMRGVLISHLAPNPAKDYLSFTYSGSDLVSPITVNVFNELGQKVSSEELTEIHKNMQIAINTRDLGNGVYQLFISQQDKSEVQKFVVLR